MVGRALDLTHNKTVISKSRLTEGRFVALSIVAMVAAFALLIVFVNGGGVRHVSIFWKERIDTTVAFRNVKGELKVLGLKGTTQVNPTLVARTGDTAYVLTVINQDTIPHLFYIADGLNIHTKIIRPGQNDTITIYPKSEGTYNYYDWVTKGKPLAQFKAVRIGGD
jgi:hypothetical protein